MGRVNIPVLSFTIITLSAGLVFLILGIKNWGQLCGLGYFSVLLGSLILICPMTCLLATLAGSGKFGIFTWSEPKDIEKPLIDEELSKLLTDEELIELEKLEMEAD